MIVTKRLRSSGRVRAAAVLFAIGALVAVAASAARVPSNLRLAGLEGGTLTSADLERGTHVLVVWASWSPRCRDIVDRVNGLAGRWSSRARVATINFQEDADTVSRFLRGQGLRVPVYLDRDGEASKSLAVTALPGLVVSRDGEILYQGRLPADPDALLDDLLR